MLCRASSGLSRLWRNRSRVVGGRELPALAWIRTGNDLTGEKGVESEFVGGLSARIPPKGGVEMAEVVDIDELLRVEPVAATAGARPGLEVPNNTHTGPNMLAPRRSPAAHGMPGPVASSSGAQPASLPTAVAAVELSPTEKAISEIVANANARVSQQVAPDRSSTNRAATANRTGASASPKASAALPSVDAAAGAASSAKTTAQINVDVPLRELSLAWFEARGYRGAPASPAVRPIELVLRH